MNAEQIQGLIDSGTRIPKGYHELERPVNLRGRYGAIVEGCGPETVLTPVYTDPFPVIDMTGAMVSQVNNIRLTGKRTRPGYVGILVARNSTGTSAGLHSFSNVIFDGNWILSCVVNLASEVNSWNNIVALNHQPGGRCIILTDLPSPQETKDLKSPFGEVAGLAENCNCNAFNQGHMGVYGYHGTEDICFLENVAGVQFNAVSFSGKSNIEGNVGANSIISIRRSHAFGFIDRVSLRDCYAEANGSRYGVYALGEVDNFVMDNCMFTTGGSVVHGDGVWNNARIAGGLLESQGYFDWDTDGIRPMFRFNELRRSLIKNNYRYSRLQSDITNVADKRKFATQYVWIVDADENNTIITR